MPESFTPYRDRIGAIRSLLGTEVNNEEVSVLAQLFKQPEIRRRIEEYETQDQVDSSAMENSLNSESVECGSRQSLHPLDTNLPDTVDLTSEPHELDGPSIQNFQRPRLHRRFSIPPGAIENVRDRQIYRERTP
jgi:hypothetical protein